MGKVNRTVKRALDILKLLKDKNKPMTITQISIVLDLPRSSTFDILHTLLQEGYIEYDNKELKTYMLGLKVFEVGAAYLNNTDLSPTARPFLEKMMAEAGATAFLAIENNGQLVYLDKVEAPTAIRTSAVLGSRSEMYCTGLGKALLTTYPGSKVRRIFDKSNVKKHTENTITDFDELMKELKKTWVRGYAIDNRETDRELFCIAAPVFERIPEDMLIEELKKAGLPADGKVRLINGRTGEAFDNTIVVGRNYILKLIHMVEEKIHARSTGPYSLVTQQPLGGKAQMGGQRLGEMEV